MHRNKFPIIKPTRCTNFSNLFLEWNSTCFGQFLCPSSGVFHCTHSNGICRTGFADSLRAGSGWNADHDQQRCYHYAPTVKPEAVNAVVSSWWWAWTRPKHVERHKTSSNKLVKLLHLVG